MRREVMIVMASVVFLLVSTTSIAQTSRKSNNSASSKEAAEISEESLKGPLHLKRYDLRDGKGWVYSWNDNIYDIYDNDGWAYSPITITWAPEYATVCSIDVCFYIVHTYIGDLVVQLMDEDSTHILTLWNRQGGME